MRHFFLLAIIGAGLSGQEILRPTGGSYVRPGPLSIVAKGSSTATLTLDGAPVVLKQEGPGALSATIRVAAGKHTLTLKDGAVERRIEFTGGEGEPQFRTHPPAATCDTCHAVKNGEWSFKSAVLGDSCFGCHDTGAFAPKHTHTPDTLPDCQLCHLPHGSAAARHLKMVKETACKQCHG